ncbi:MAG: hypothetical protein DRN21_03460 [Thermoplasmata archaeon]|nr:MAG: hypothetical protein DRN21_03460 [Thermoplasmata archaeon]
MMNSKGQVGVIVAILVITVMVTVLITVQVYYVPQWMKGRESEHMDMVTNQLAGLKYSLDLLAMEQSSSALMNSITLGSKELPYFVSSRAFGSLQIISSDDSNFSVSVTGSGMVSQSYTNSSFTSDEVNNVLSVSSFELVIETLEDGDTYNATLSDNATTNASVSAVVWQSGIGYQINLTITSGVQELFDQPVAVALPSGTSYTINLLNDDYKLSTDILSSISTPFNVSFAASSPTHGHFQMEGNRYVSATISYSSEFGTIQYTANNAYFVDQDYIYEGGAVVISQSTGNSLLYPPTISVSNVTKILNMTVIDITGVAGKTGVSGYGTYSIRSTFLSSSTYQCYGDTLTINITTDYPNAWGTYLNNTLGGNGIENAVTTGSNYVSISLNAFEFTLSKVVLQAQVGPGWIT